MENERENEKLEHHTTEDLEEGELEDGEVEEHATKSPLPRTTPPVPSTGGDQLPGAARCCGVPAESATWQSSAALAAVRSPHAQAPAPAAPGGAVVTRAPPTEPRAFRAAPPTAPRALRQSSTGNVAYVPSTPHAARAPPTGPRAADPARPAYSAGHRRPASPHRDTPPAKRQRPPPVVINTIPDEQGNKILRLETLVRVREKRIDDLQWALAEAKAQLHIYKTRGPDHFDPTLNEHLKRKFWKRNNLDLAKDNWRLDELSDISDEESVRSPTRPPSPHTTTIAHLSPADNADRELSPGQIYTVYGELDDAADASCAFDDTDSCGDAAANMDMVAGDRALRRRITDAHSKQADEPSWAAQELSKQELLEQTAIVQYGIRFSYTLSLWQENGRWLPAPLGRFGQPFWKGSAWEDFDPRRIFMKDGAERVALDSTLFLQLAQDAARIAFVYRSATQRQVVSLALQNKLGLVNGHELDMVSLCRTNPTRLPIAIRRHYRRNANKNIFYTEYDAADISNHIILSLAGPQKTQDGLTRKDYQDQRRAWLQLVEIFVLDWLPLFCERLPDPQILVQDIVPWPVEINLVDREVRDDELYTAMWAHFTSNGVPRRCLLPGGDFHDYIRRGRVMENERRRWVAEFNKIAAQETANQDVQRVWVGDRLRYDPVPEGFPVLRVKLGEQKQKQLAMKYRERRNYKGFIPV